MIFITVGTANKGFERLIQTCDTIADKFKIDFFAQIGHTEYNPVNIPFKRWLTADEMQIKYSLADAFIVHCGFGTISEVLALNKPIIAVPRLFENGEAVNDQRDLGFKLDSLEYVKCVTDLDKLEHIIINIKSLKLNNYNIVSDIPDIINRQINIFKENKPV